MLDDVDEAGCLVKVTYGYEDKPYLVQGPHDTPSQIERWLAKLEEVCGPDGFNYTLEIVE